MQDKSKLSFACGELLLFQPWYIQSFHVSAAKDVLHVQDCLPAKAQASEPQGERRYLSRICSHKLEPIDIHIRCMGQAGTLEQRYQSINPPHLLARVPSFTRKMTPDISQNAYEGSRSSIDVSTSMLRSVAHTGLQSQVEAVESVYRKTVRQLEQMAHQACITCAP